MKWQAVVVLHVSGDALEPDRLLGTHPVPNTTAFRKGEAAAFGRTHSLSGFQVDLGEASSKAALQQEVLAHLQEHSALYGEAAEAGAQMSLGIGLMVPAKEPRTVTLDRDVLAALLNAGITVHVTGYPCTDDEDGTDQECDPPGPQPPGGDRG
jgi:hypothetical protein